MQIAMSCMSLMQRFFKRFHLLRIFKDNGYILKQSQEQTSILHKFDDSVKFFMRKHITSLVFRDLCIKNRTNVLLHRISNTYDFAFIYLCTQSRLFDNSKMVKWVYIAQKLTKIEQKMLNAKF